MTVINGEIVYESAPGAAASQRQISACCRPRISGGDLMSMTSEERSCRRLVCAVNPWLIAELGISQSGVVSAARNQLLREQSVNVYAAY